MEGSDGESRLGWLDAMRGLAIILVVFVHVLNFSLGQDEDHRGALYSMILMFIMPLFFFISGFFAYRVCGGWTLQRVCDFVKRRFQALIICTLVFFVLAMFCCGGLHTQIKLAQHGSVLGYLRVGGFCGYWFTIVLFQMLMVSLVLSLLSRLFKSERILEVGLILISIAAWKIVDLHLLDDSMLWGVLCTENFCKYFQFFTVGIFCRKYQAQFEALLSKNWFKAGITVCAVGYLIQRFHCQPIYVPGDSYALLLVVVAFFFGKREFFEKQNATSSALRYIGRRTLDIYMIHYFFFPDLRVLAEWLAPNSMFVLQLAIGLAVSALIIVPCLLLGEVVRMSGFLSAWLFGVRPKKQD